MICFACLILGLRSLKMDQIDQLIAYKILQVQEIGKVEPRRPGRPRGPGWPGHPRRPGRPPKRGRPGRPPKYPRGMTLEQQAQRQRNRLKEVRSGLLYICVQSICIFQTFRSLMHGFLVSYVVTSHCYICGLNSCTFVALHHVTTV